MNLWQQTSTSTTASFPTAFGLLMDELTFWVGLPTPSSLLSFKSIPPSNGGNGSSPPEGMNVSEKQVEIYQRDLFDNSMNFKDTSF